MGSLLKSCRNTRKILPNSFRYIRSDVPVDLSDEEIQWLLNNDIRTIIDLRSEEEQLHKSCPLQMHSEFEYYSLPVSGGNVVPPSPDKVSVSYLAMVDEQMEHILQTIENSNHSVLYFCNAGKDRTGVVSALLLKKMGFDEEYIISDYLLSAENLKEMLEQYATDSGINLEIITPQRRYMEEFLHNLKK